SLYEIGNTIAEAAAAATDTKVTRRTLGYAAPQWPNKPLAEAAYANMKAVGMPEWTEADHTFARMVQEANGLEVEPLETEVAELGVPDDRPSTGGGSDDIGDIMWTVPTITIRFPSNVPNTIGHHVKAAMPMAPP